MVHMQTGKLIHWLTDYNDMYQIVLGSGNNIKQCVYHSLNCQLYHCHRSQHTHEYNL